MSASASTYLYYMIILYNHSYYFYRISRTDARTVRNQSGDPVFPGFPFSVLSP
jgi:hypothetical protein